MNETSIESIESAVQQGYAVTIKPDGTVEVGESERSQLNPLTQREALGGTY